MCDLNVSCRPQKKKKEEVPKDYEDAMDIIDAFSGYPYYW